MEIYFLKDLKPYLTRKTFYEYGHFFFFFDIGIDFRLYVYRKQNVVLLGLKTNIFATYIWFQWLLSWVEWSTPLSLKKMVLREREKDNTVKNTDTNITDLVQTLDESDPSALTSGKHFNLFISFFFLWK